MKPNVEKGHGGIENPRWPPALIIIVLHEYFVFGADWKSKILTIGISLRWKNFFFKNLIKKTHQTVHKPSVVNE